jgi:hypothetical protein
MVPLRTRIDCQLGGRMKMRSLVTQCPCSGIVPPILLWVGENNTIIVEGICLACGDKVQALSSFRELQTIAKELRGEPIPLNPPLAKVDDKQWLHDMGVSFD